MIFLRKRCVHVGLLPSARAVVPGGHVHRHHSQPEVATSGSLARELSLREGASRSVHAGRFIKATAGADGRLGIVALLDGARVSGKRSAEPGFEIVRSLPHGHVAAGASASSVRLRPNVAGAHRRREARVQSDRSADHSTDHRTGIEAGLPPRVGAGDGSSSLALWSVHQCRRARTTPRSIG